LFVVGSLQRRNEFQPLVDCHDAGFRLLPELAQSERVRMRDPVLEEQAVWQRHHARGTARGGIIIL
jgi:hypothetical protein